MHVTTDGTKECNDEYDSDNNINNNDDSGWITCVLFYRGSSHGRIRTFLLLQITKYPSNDKGDVFICK